MEFGRRIFLLLFADGASAAGVLRGGTNLHAGAEPLFFEDHGWVKIKVPGKYVKPDLNIADGTKVMVEGGVVYRVKRNVTETVAIGPY